MGGKGWRVMVEGELVGVEGEEGRGELVGVEGEEDRGEWVEMNSEGVSGERMNGWRVNGGERVRKGWMSLCGVEGEWVEGKWGCEGDGGKGEEGRDEFVWGGG